MIKSLVNLGQNATPKIQNLFNIAWFHALAHLLQTQRFKWVQKTHKLELSQKDAAHLNTPLFAVQNCHLQKKEKRVCPFVPNETLYAGALLDPVGGS